VAGKVWEECSAEKVVPYLAYWHLSDLREENVVPIGREITTTRGAKRRILRLAQRRLFMNSGFSSISNFSTRLVIKR
jgi:hypothetical protein